MNIKDMDITGKEWCDKKRNVCVSLWASSTLAKKFGKPSMGFVDPADVTKWAFDSLIHQWLPQEYRP